MAVTIDPKTQKLNIRFRVNGYNKQFYISTGLKNSPKNRTITDSRWEEIQREISLGIFDPTLERYKFGSKNLNTEIKHSELSISDLWEKFCEFKARLIKPSTANNYETFGKILLKLPQSLTSAPQIREQLLQNHSYHVARQVISSLSSACDWAVDSKLIFSNPFKSLLLPKQKTQNDSIKAFTLEQRDLIIAEFERSATYSCYTSLVKFLFFTGCRPGEAFALCWGDVAQDCTKITINKSYATRVASLGATKNNKKRVFSCGSGSKLQNLLLSIRPISPDKNSLVFQSTLGQRVNLRILWRAWGGYWSKKKFYSGVVKQLSDKGQVPYLSVYGTRHTFATWAIAHGASPEKVAYWLGDTIQTVLIYYCHPDVTKSEAPDF
ncbi:phage integrase family protein [Nostoc commune NIES-4072]|uniref:Phage integrase family protein n=1 Tax=Nostoc commune NIES-4072 TaxID=2005467 RepID=A0A2R5FV94_NOSCO|nr:tyrosine-type recombinase/integrase [Nostoc commune]BBD66352.1 phage integrase family protein [Nostoc commune HK-02]GBG22667.1 phage integrase family protein [Nostoc commune NIES-4072]